MTTFFSDAKLAGGIGTFILTITSAGYYVASFLEPI